MVQVARKGPAMGMLQVVRKEPEVGVVQVAREGPAVVGLLVPEHLQGKIVGARRLNNCVAAQC
jgi:hypothetical protein